MGYSSSFLALMFRALETLIFAPSSPETDRPSFLLAGPLGPVKGMCDAAILDLLLCPAPSLAISVRMATSSNRSPGNSGGALGFEATLWATADKLRGNFAAAGYEHVLLNSIFLKSLSDAFDPPVAPRS